MSNFISYDRRPDLDVIPMSNGLTSVVVSVLSLAASSLAQTDRHRELAVWLASHDQGVYGLGVVGFDVAELPWRADTFESDRAFLFAVMEAATARIGWDRLGYDPHEESVRDRLERLRRLIDAFDIMHAEANADSAITSDVASFELCPEHAVYRHAHGCIVCNDR